METILLCGPKHAGKTSAGRALAALLSGAFIDLDECIEARTGKSPRALYREGPGVFRQAEAEALDALLAPRDTAGDRGPRIIAAGGGLIDNPEALALLEKYGTAVTACIEVSAETAWERISRNAEKDGLPPFLNTENPRETHRALHERRAAAYRAWARVAVRGEGKSPEEIAGDVLRRGIFCQGAGVSFFNS